MEFFNKKEEVLEIRLTQFGKRKYADGKFNPKYYAFYDDDILYDSQYAGITESAHTASVRISDMLRMKIQSSFHGIETDINKKIEKIRRTNNNIAPENIQQIKEKSYSLSNPLGNSDTTKDYAPTWEFKSYFNEINKTTKTTTTGSMHTMPIPQINMQDLKYKIVAKSKPDFNANIFGHTFEDGTALSVDYTTGEMLVGIRENNSPLSNDKFDMEIYMVNEENGEENLLPLFFKSQTRDIIDGVLVDTAEDSEIEIDETFAEKYLIIEVDSEISEETLKRALGKGVATTGMDAVRTYDIPATTHGDNPMATNGYVGSEIARGLSLDDIANLSAQELLDMERAVGGADLSNLITGDGDKSITDGIYNEPPNDTPENCDDD